MPLLRNSRGSQHSLATLHFKLPDVFSSTNYLVDKIRGHSVSEHFLSHIDADLLFLVSKRQKSVPVFGSVSIKRR